MRSAHVKRNRSIRHGKSVMAHVPDLVDPAIARYLREHETKRVLRVAVCGGTGGRARALCDRLGTPKAGDRESAVVVARRTLVVAAADAASTGGFLATAAGADVAIVVTDAADGVSSPARRASYLALLAGVRKLVLAVADLDRVAGAEHAFPRIEVDYASFARAAGIADVRVIPLVSPAWYHGPSLAQYLETVETDDTRLQGEPLRIQVERVERAHDGSGDVLSGRVASGLVKCGDRVRVQPSGRESAIARLADGNQALPVAAAGQRVTVALADAMPIAAGDVISAAYAPAEVADQFEATIVATTDEPLFPGRPYALRLGGRSISATITEPKYRVHPDTLERLAAKRFERDEIGVCNIALDAAIAFDPSGSNRHTGTFALVDRASNQAIGAGVLHFALRRAHNIHLQHLDVDKSARALQKGQRPVVLWFTGLSGAGKSTIANLVEKKLHAMGRHSYLLDGDNVRHGLNRDLGFTEGDRVENIRRVAEVAKLMVDAGLIVLTAFISPFRAERDMARRLVKEGEFFEIHVDTPLEVAERRDVKGLYRKARRGELANFTGIDSPYEPPERPELRLDTVHHSPDDAAELVIERLRVGGAIH